MIVKSKDTIRTAVARLEELLARKTNSKKQRETLEREMALLRRGGQGENDAASHIDLHLDHSKNWAVIHDLRIEHNGRVAGIDHLLIGRFFDIFVIKSKYFNTPLRVDANGEFQVRNRLGWKGIASPIEQNKRHIIVLNELINAHALTPMRLGLAMRPAYHNWVLVPPDCNISRRHGDETIILKMDLFNRRLSEFTNTSTLFDDVLSVAKICSTQTIMEFARKLVSYHRPASADLAARFRPPIPAAAPASQRGKAPLHPRCHECGAKVEPGDADFCRANSQRFGKRILCADCQATAPALHPRPSGHRPAAKNGGSRARTA